MEEYSTAEVYDKDITAEGTQEEMKERTVSRYRDGKGGEDYFRRKENPRGAGSKSSIRKEERKRVRELFVHKGDGNA